MKRIIFISIPLSCQLVSAQAFSEAQGISNSDWQLGMRNANATGTASIPGYNVTAKYPGERSDNWTVSISVSSDIPGGNTAGGQFVTGTQIEWTAPQGLIGSADPSWFLCRTAYSSSKLMGSESAPSQGSCNGILSDNCWSDLQESLEAGGQCQNNTLPPSCTDELGLSDGEGFGLTTGIFNSLLFSRTLLLTMIQHVPSKAIAVTAHRFSYGLAMELTNLEILPLTTAPSDKSGSWSQDSPKLAVITHIQGALPANQEALHASKPVRFRETAETLRIQQALHLYR